MKNTKNLLENPEMRNFDSKKVRFESNSETKSISTGLWNAKAIQQYGNTTIGRDLSYAIVARLPHLPVKRCGPRISHAVLVEDFVYCITCVMQQNLVLREVFCEWPLQKFNAWWIQCQETRVK